MNFAYKREIISIFIAGFFIASAIFLLFPQKIIYDAANYEQIGWNLSQGHGFSNSIKPPYEPAVNREPVYPLFIGAIYKVFGRQPYVVRFLQALLHSFTAILIFMLAKHWFSSRIAFIAGILTAVDPTLAGYCGYLLTEPLVVFLLALTTYLMIILRDRHNVLSASLIGILLGLLTLSRAVFLFLPIFVIIYILFFTSKVSFKYRLLQTILIIVIFTAILAPWLYRNKKIYNVPFITTRSGYFIMYRALQTEYTPREALIYTIYGISDSLGRKLFPNEYEELTVWGTRGPDHVWERIDKIFLDFESRGYSDLEADREARRMAFDIIKKRPLKYLIMTIPELTKILFFERLLLLYKSEAVSLMKESKAYYYLFMTLRMLIRYVYSWVILVSAFAGFWIIRKDLRSKIILFMPIIYLAGISLTMYTFPRYIQPIIPYILIFSAVGLNKKEFIKCA